MEQRPDDQFPYIGHGEKMLAMRTFEGREFLVDYSPYGDIALDRDLDCQVDLEDFNIDAPPKGDGLWVWEGSVSWRPSTPDPDPPEPYYKGKWRRPDRIEVERLLRGERLWPGQECTHCKRRGRGDDSKNWRSVRKGGVKYCFCDAVACHDALGKVLYDG